MHGWVYRLGDGRLRHIDVSVSDPAQLEGIRQRAVEIIVQTRARYYARGGVDG